jgi:DNA polymerase-3 subunit delta'
MQFSKIINQQAVKQQLVELIQHNRLSHALLFLSKEGTGALSLAFALAQYLTCERANPKTQKTNSNISLSELTTHDSRLTTDSCGICPSCLKASQLVHPDIHSS